MSPETERQSRASAEQNRDFFAGSTYQRNADRIDTHAKIRSLLTQELTGTKRLLDVGNGGLFEYDPSVIEDLVAVDLFLDEAQSGDFPPNVTVRQGDALDLKEEEGSFDVVLEAFLYHHLTGRKASDSVSNTTRAISEASRMLRPGGRLIIVESCIPAALYGVERLLYQPLRALASTPVLGGHPATLQLPIKVLNSLVGSQLDIQRSEEIKLGRWVTQFGRRWPSALTPVRAHLIVAQKPAA